MSGQRELQGSIVFTRRAQESFTESFKSRVYEVYAYFPELHSNKIKCTALRADVRYLGQARSWVEPQQIALQPGVAREVIAHEFTHLLQARKFKETLGIPHGEEACDIWTWARMPLEMLDARPTYLLSARLRYEFDWKRHKEQIKQICQDAIDYRKTHRQYIDWATQEIKKLHIQDLEIQKDD